MDRPLCRTCGKPIPKRTETTYWRFNEGAPLTRTEAQRRMNGQIVSLAWGDYDGHRYVHRVSTWDGESYVDRYFCTGGCAQRFGRFAIDHPACETKAYADALRAQETDQ